MIVHKLEPAGSRGKLPNIPATSFSVNNITLFCCSSVVSILVCFFLLIYIFFGFGDIRVIVNFFYIDSYINLFIFIINKHCAVGCGWSAISLIPVKWSYELKHFRTFTVV